MIACCNIRTGADVMPVCMSESAATVTDETVLAVFGIAATATYGSRRLVAARCTSGVGMHAVANCTVHSTAPARPVPVQRGERMIDL